MSKHSGATLPFSKANFYVLEQERNMLKITSVTKLRKLLSLAQLTSTMLKDKLLKMQVQSQA